MKSKIELRFSKAHHGVGMGIINSMKSYYYSVDRPNNILFSAYVSSNYETSSKIDTKIAALPETYRMPMDYSHDSGKHGIPAKHAIVFLDFLITLTKDHADTLYVSKNDLDSFMKDLVSNGHLTPTQVGHYTGKIPVVYDIKDMVEDARTHRDAGLALKLAQLYKEKGSTSSHIYWLNQAKTFNGSHPFFAAPENLAASLKGIESANLHSLFHEGDSANWLLDKIAACPTFKRLEFGVFFDPSCITKTFADFLAKSQNISTLEMGSVWSADAWMRMSAAHARTLAGALRLNKSVESLNVSDQRIGDEGLIALVDALVANPETKLKNLNIFCCGITEQSATYLLKNIDKIPSLRSVNLKYNQACNNATINAVDVVLAARKTQVATPAASAGTKVAKDEGKTDVASKKEENTYKLSSAGIGGIIQPALSPTGQLHKAMPHLGGWYNFGEQGFALHCNDENEAKSISEKLSKIFSGLSVNVSYKRNPYHLTFVMINLSKRVSG